MTDREKIAEYVKNAFDIWIDEYEGTSYFNIDEIKQVKKYALELLKEQKTTFEKDGHHIRFTSCGNYWCDTDNEGDLFPHNYCPHCGKAMKQDENRRMEK